MSLYMSNAAVGCSGAQQSMRQHGCRLMCCWQPWCSSIWLAVSVLRATGCALRWAEDAALLLHMLPQYRELEAIHLRLVHRPGHDAIAGNCCCAVPRQRTMAPRQALPLQPMAMAAATMRLPRLAPAKAAKPRRAAQKRPAARAGAAGRAPEARGAAGAAAAGVARVLQQGRRTTGTTRGPRWRLALAAWPWSEWPDVFPSMQSLQEAA